MKKKRNGVKFFTFLLLILIALLVLIRVNKKESFDIRTRASVEDDAKYCVNPPECCARMDQSHDAHECEWPIRGYCKNCGAIEGPNEKCGWYWIWHDANDNEYKLGTNGPDGYGCMIGDGPGGMRPKYNPDGSINKPQPTTPPTAIPAQKPTSTPAASTPVPTKEAPQLEPTKKPTQPVQPKPRNESPTTVIRPRVIDVFESPTPTPIPFKLNFRLPRIQLNLVKINSAIKKPLGLFEYIFERVVYYDRLLENTINSKLDDWIKNQ